MDICSQTMDSNMASVYSGFLGGSDVTKGSF